MATKKYWKGLEELAQSPEFVNAQQNEFTEQLPVEQLLSNASDENSTSRRDFLKFLGFSVTAASLAACEAPVTKAIPYVVKPEEITPGVANFYASTHFDGNDYCSVLVKTREGRPIKIEGNELSPITKGATNARVQASVLSLYDSNRITGPFALKAATTWVDADKQIASKLADIAAKGGNIRILSSTIISPSTKQVIADFVTKYPSTKHVSYDAVSYSSIAKANQASFGKAVIPTYKFDAANVIVGIGADFLINWLSPIEYAKQYSVNRKVNSNKKEMSKHIQIESNLSVTGANADKRIQAKPSQMALAAVNLYNAVAKMTGGSSVASASLEIDKELEQVAKMLVESKGKALVVCGINDINAQLFVNAINNMIGSYGVTIDMETPSYTKQGSDEEFASLVAEMKEGKVDAVITYNTNPAYTAPASLNFADAYGKVKVKISIADRMDETASLSDFVCPDHHYLESWNDFNPRKGHYSLSQPTIAPIFSKPRHEGTRAAQESLLAWAGNTTDYLTYMQQNWEKTIFSMQSSETMFTSFWNKSLQDGVVAIVATMPVAVDAKKETNAAKPEEKKVEETPTQAPSSDLASAAQAIVKSSKGGAWELAIYEKAGIGIGTQPNNPWLLELPDPISKVTWDNYITMSPIDMKEMGLNMLERQDREGSIVNLTVAGKTIPVPVYSQPGQTPKTIGLAVGYGRTGVGKAAENVGVNAFPFAQLLNGTVQMASFEVNVEKTGNTHEFAATQIHHTMMGREIVREATLAEYIENPAAGNEPEMLNTLTGKQPLSKVDLWDAHDSLGHHWGMTIDLNSCIGCGACVVSCTAENNVAVVGKAMVMNTREMHWLRIDRYYSSDMSFEKAHKEGVGLIDEYLEMENPAALNPKVVFQPVMCQHCNHAPCETVCPVLATTHSTEGYNQMTYNRCIGTRYCANNCPYKVRRFNWFNYNDNTKFADVNPVQDDLGRMVLNPDVVVRSRGVMEKCSMCVQRVQGGKLTAKKEGRKIKDGEIKTACAQSCPTNAIIFGDINDPTSEISQYRKEERNYFLLEDVGAKPTVSYMTKITNEEKAEA